MNGSSIDTFIKDNNIDDTDTAIFLYADEGVEINTILNDNIFGDLVDIEIIEDEVGTGIINYSGNQAP